MAPEKYPCRVAKFNSERCFGVEVELGNSIQGETIASAIIAAGSKRGVEVTRAYRHDYDNVRWHVKYDRSCGDVVGDYGWEIATFKASGVKSLEEIGESLNSVKEAGATTNDRCALHVHVEVKDYSWLQMAVLVSHWAKSENIFRNMVPPHRDLGTKNVYSRFLCDEPWMLDLISKNICPEPALVWDRCRPRHIDDTNRRKSLNLVNFALITGRPTIEFRFPESTLIKQEVKSWVRIFIHMVDRCLNFGVPKTLSPYSLNEFMNTFGLVGSNPFIILSPGLRETKLWMSKRLVKYSRNASLKEEATKVIKNISKE